jgi:hypothetical protein
MRQCNGMTGSENIDFGLLWIVAPSSLSGCTIVFDDHGISIFKIKVKCFLCINDTDIGFQVFMVVSECSDFCFPVCDAM